MPKTIPRAAISLIAVLVIAAAALPARTQTQGTKKRPAARPRTAKQQAEFDRVAAQADAARESARLDDAVKLYNQALQLKPTWVEGWWYLGSIFYDRDRYGEASEALRNVLSLERGNGPAWALLGLCEFQLHHYDEALSDIQYGSRIGLGGNKALTDVARFHGAILMTRSGQFELAYEALRPFAREGNESLTIIEALGMCVLRMPLLPAELPPDKRELVLLAGRAAYYQAGRHPREADQAYKELLARYPEAPNANYAYGVFQLIDTPDAALESFRRELQVSPANVPAILQIAFEYIKRSDFEAARPFAERAVATAPELFAARNALGRVLLELGRINDAIRELETGVKQAPDSPEMRFALARAYQKAGRKEDAARERSVFLQLDKQAREQREGAQAIGGIDAKPAEKVPPPK